MPKFKLQLILIIHFTQLKLLVEIGLTNPQLTEHYSHKWHNWNKNLVLLFDDTRY